MEREFPPSDVAGTSVWLLWRQFYQPYWRQSKSTFWSVLLDTFYGDIWCLMFEIKMELKSISVQLLLSGIAPFLPLNFAPIGWWNCHLSRFVWDIGDSHFAAWYHWFFDGSWQTLIELPASFRTDSTCPTWSWPAPSCRSPPRRSLSARNVSNEVSKTFRVLERFETLSAHDVVWQCCRRCRKVSTVTMVALSRSMVRDLQWFF